LIYKRFSERSAPEEVRIIGTQNYPSIINLSFLVMPSHALRGNHS